MLLFVHSLVPEYNKGSKEGELLRVRHRGVHT